MTKIDTQRLRELMEKATPGPWRLKTSGNFGNMIEADSGKRSGLHLDDGMRSVASYQYCGPSDRYDEQEATTAATGELIVAAVNALPALLARIAELEAEREKVLAAPVAEVTGHDEGGDEVPVAFMPDGIEVGQRVRLVPVAEVG